MSNSTSAPAPTPSSAPQDTGFSPWQRLKTKRISYLVLPLLLMATVVEFVILATGLKYQQLVCVPQGMGVMLFGIGPIGATILAVELLKLPLAIWTAARHGWQKTFMLFVGLPLICVLTFQLVKDMAVYEMSTAMKPAGQFLEQAAAEEIKINHLNGELAAIEGKKTERERKLAELAAKETKAKSDFEASVKRNEEIRQDAISLTDYQKKELSEVESRQATIIKQFDADAAGLTKVIADLRAQREVELGRATKWNAEEARIENDYKTKLAAYTNKKNTYDKDKAEYDNASILKRQLLKEPVHPGVPPEREANTILKPTTVAEMDAQIKAKEDELTAVSNKRRDRVAQVETDARRLRAEFDQRSSTKREQTDTKRDELAAAHAALLASLKAEEKQVDAEVAAAVKNVDGIRAEIDASRKQAEGFYEAREQAIRNTQVHRIATTVEIVRGLIFGERPMSITATAKERGDILTDQISMVRIWVYPVLAFIVAFLPTLMVEIGFSTLFVPEQQRPPHRLGFLGRRLHWLYKRAGRQKILRAERLASEATGEIALREKSLANVKASADKALFEKDAELITAREELGSMRAAHEEQLAWQQAEFDQQARQTEEQWTAKLAGMADSLNRTVIEKDALRDLQRSEIERQVAMRQNAWSDRITQMRQELDDQRATAETERTTLMQEHQKKLMEVTEDCKTQVIQARRQLADAELAAVEKNAKLAHDLKHALHARDAAESQLKHQADSLSVRLSQSEEDAARQLEKATREEKHRAERQQLDFENRLRQREEDFERRLKQREQELALASDARAGEAKAKADQDARLREAELERQLENRSREVEARWKQEAQQREEVAQSKLKQREQQLQTQVQTRVDEVQAQAQEQLRRNESELQRQLEAQAREVESRLREELQQKELTFHARLKQREQEWTAKAAARETELQSQWAADLRGREEEWERQAESRARAAESRLGLEAQQKEELFMAKVRQQDLQWQAKLDAARADAQAQTKELLRRREAEAEAGLRELEISLRKEMQQKEESFQAKARQREQDLTVTLTAQAEARQVAARKQWESETEIITRAAVEPLKSMLSRAELEREDARESASEAIRQVQHLEKKLTEASTFLNGWRNGKAPVDSHH